MEQFRYFMSKMTRKRDKLVSTLAPHSHRASAAGGQADLRFQIIQKVGQLLDTTDEKQLCSLQSSLNARIEEACSDHTCRPTEPGSSS